MKRIILEKTYNWETIGELEEDMSVAADKVADSQHTDEWDGEIEVVITYKK